MFEVAPDDTDPDSNPSEDVKLYIPAVLFNDKLIVSLDVDFGSVYPGYWSVIDTLTDPEFKLDKFTIGVDWGLGPCAVNTKLLG